MRPRNCSPRVAVGPSGRCTTGAFDTAAQAIRFAIEELPAPLLLGAYLQVEDDRFDSEQIPILYESTAYPLTRSHAEK
jgi:hypothetical protein